MLNECLKYYHTEYDQRVDKYAFEVKLMGWKNQWLAVNSTITNLNSMNEAMLKVSIDLTAGIRRRRAAMEI